MRTYARLISILICLAIAVSLAACSTPTATPTPGSTPVPTVTPTPAPVVLEIYHKLGSNALPAWDRMFAQYTKEVPNVTFTMTDGQAAGDYAPAIAARIASGDIPQIFMSGTFADNDHYAPYSEVLDDLPVWDKITAGAITAITTDGKKVSLPYAVQFWGLFYNKKIFADAGITELPDTLSKLATVCATLKSKGIAPFAAYDKTEWAIHQLLMFPLDSDMKDPAAEYAKLSKGELILKDLPVMKKLTDFMELYKDNRQDKPSGYTYELASAEVANGKAAMMVQGDWTEGIIEGITPNIEMAFMPMPFSENPADCRIFAQPSATIRIGKDTKNVAESKAFLTWLVLSPWARTWWAEDEGTLTVFEGSVAPPGKQLIASALEITTAHPDMSAFWGEFLLPTELHLAMDTWDIQYNGDQITPQEWIDGMSSEWQKYAAAQK